MSEEAAEPLLPAGRRALELEGRAVRGADGGMVGRVRDVYLRDADGALAAFTVLRRQLSSREVLLPVTVIDAPPEDDREGAPTREHAESILLRISAAEAKAGPRPPATGHLGAAELETVRERFADGSGGPAIA